MPIPFNKNNIISVIQQVSALERLEDTYSFRYRQICREFAKKYNVSLIEVEKLPEEYVLSHYYEDIFANLHKSEVVEFIKERYFPEILEKEEFDITSQMDELEQIQAQQLENKQKQSLKQDKSSKNQDTGINNTELKSDQSSKTDDVNLSFDVDEDLGFSDD